jgi:hypothetical protein
MLQEVIQVLGGNGAAIKDFSTAGRAELLDIIASG